VVAGIWQDELGLQRVGRNDNFFDIGGHSLMLVRVHRRLIQIFNTALALVDLYRLPTVAALARAIASELSAQPGRAPALAPELVMTATRSMA
jgi:Phosphopantetheine attachment site